MENPAGDTVTAVASNVPSDPTSAKMDPVAKEVTKASTSTSTKHNINNGNDEQMRPTVKANDDQYIDQLAERVQSFINKCFDGSMEEIPENVQNDNLVDGLNNDAHQKMKEREQNAGSNDGERGRQKQQQPQQQQHQEEREKIEGKVAEEPVLIHNDNINNGVGEEQKNNLPSQPNDNDDNNNNVVVNEPRPEEDKETTIIKRPLQLPSISITNEYGQESISMDSVHQQSIYHEQQGQQHIEMQLQNKPKIAVTVKNVSFSYSRKNKVLSNINLIVPKAQIFGLLGASGCGKTTLLKIILARLSPKKGEVRVFGHYPGSTKSRIPGSGVGFMPQELALFPTFTIAETLYYIGMLHHIPKDEIDKRTDFLIELLNLPAKNHKVEQCSGGQQRRVSIAVTLFHSPPLLILDEPTVGVDPLLRLKIWQYLEYLTLNNRMTIIITTHYIEESGRANNLAFMRFGRILTQDSPENLLRKYNTNILENVYLILCQQDCGDIKQKHSIKKRDQSREMESPIRGLSYANEQEEEEKPNRFRNFTVDLTRMKALYFKNIVDVKRNPLMFFFFLALPVIQIILLCVSLYKSPDNIDVSVYNADGKGLSKRFLEKINSELVNLKPAHSLHEAIKAVEDGKSWMAIHMDKNFSQAYRRRAKNPAELTDEDFESSKIKLYPDNTDSFVYLVLDNVLLAGYQEFVEDVAESFGYNPASVRIPLNVQEVIYDQLNRAEGYKLLNSLISGCLIAIIYTSPLIVSAQVIVLERKNEIIERTFVNGATSLEIYLTHLTTLMLALIPQTSVLLTVTLGFFDTRMIGPLWEAFLMLYLQGLTGILIGLLISTISKNEVVALVISLGAVFPIWMMAGVFWPLESIDPWLQRIFWQIPLAYPIRALNHIFRRGWTYQYYEVMLGYGSSFFYNTLLFILNVVLFHITSH